MITNPTSHPSLTPATGPERAARIADLYRRSLAAAWEAYQTNRYQVGYGQERSAQVRTYARLPLAHALLRQGDPDSVAQAAEFVAAVIDAQETAPEHPHRGNWPMNQVDAEVTDLNAIQFVLKSLVPLLAQHGHQLPPDLQARCRASLRLALEEEERLDVAPTYTNIHLMALLALVVGGEWLGDEHFIRLGRERWAHWVRFTVQSGAPNEYNSPTYGGIDLFSLAPLYDLVRDPAIRLQSRLLYERVWLHAALHLHRPTRQIAGPHSRCYWKPMVTGQERLKEILWRETGWPWLLEPGPYGGDPASTLPVTLELALSENWLPDFVAPWLENQAQALPCEIRETANRDEGFDLTTYLTPSYALGTASRTYRTGTDCFYIDHMANHLLLHYACPDRPGGWGMMYTRYVVNDRHWGAISAAPDRPKTSNFYEQGHFAGVQLRNKAIGLHALLPEPEQVFSLKTIVAFQSGQELEQVWLNDRPVRFDDLPPVEAGDWLIVADGAVYAGVQPLRQSCLGRQEQAPILLERGPAGELWLAIYNYRGPAKRFWDYASLAGPFYRGNLRAGFVVEVAERSEYPSAAAFLDHLRRASVEDAVDETHVRTVVYRSGGDELLLRYDLWHTEPKERRLNGALYLPPNLSSPLAAQGASGRLSAGSATLLTNPQQVWLIAQELDPARRAWIVANPEDQPTPLRLETPLGVVAAAAFGLGRLAWHAPEGGPQTLVVEALREPAGLEAPAGVDVQLRLLHTGVREQA